jgi:hypothetical protein
MQRVLGQLVRIDIIGVFCLVLFLNCLTITTVEASIKRVPDEYFYIIDAIEAASDGDTILIMPGVYRQSFNLQKNLTIGSMFLVNNDTSYIDSTIIDGNGRGSILYLHGPLTPIIIGLTFMNGQTPGSRTGHQRGHCQRLGGWRRHRC